MSVLVGKEAPDFTATAIMPDNSINENFNLYKYLSKDIGILFFWPMDFTFVCPSEIIAFDHRLKDFTDRKAKVIGISTDSHFTHLAWKNTSTHDGGIGNVQFPIISDITKNISRNYDVLINESVALRGTFLIDQQHIVRNQVINDLPLGRDIDEALRILDALLFYQEHGDVCPAGWHKGKEGIKADPAGIKNYLDQHADTL